MNRSIRPGGGRRRIARLRRETLRVLDATELGGVVGGGVAGVRDDQTHVIGRDQRIPTRYCIA